MTSGDVAVIIGLVLCIAAFTALVVVLVRVLQALGELRRDLGVLRDEVVPLVNALKHATDETREVIDDAREDLARFDRVIGSAESVSEALADTSRVAKTVLSAPVIKAAAIASGTKQAVTSLTSKNPPEKPKRTRRAGRSGRRSR
jgi:uncharacterized protein YoxC